MTHANELRLKIYSRIDELPTLPAAVPRLLSQMESDKSNAAEIARTISRDPALAAKVLKIANSAYYGFAREISSLSNAVSLLGFRMVRSLALSIGIIHTFPSRPDTPHFSRAGLWRHSVAVGTAVRELNRRAGGPEDPEFLFSMGLLHDIGKLVLDQFFHERFQEVLSRSCSRGPDSLPCMEREILGLDHGEIGAVVLRRWHLPEAISRPIGSHHSTGPAEDPGARALALLRVADLLAHEAEAVTGGATGGIPMLDSDLELSGLNARDIDVVRGTLREHQTGFHAFSGAIS